MITEKTKQDWQIEHITDYLNYLHNFNKHLIDEIEFLRVNMSGNFRQLTLEEDKELLELYPLTLVEYTDEKTEEMIEDYISHELDKDD